MGRTAGQRRGKAKQEGSILNEKDRRFSFCAAMTLFLAACGGKASSSSSQPLPVPPEAFSSSEAMMRETVQLQPYSFDLPGPEEDPEADPLVGAVMAGLLICGVVLLLIRLLWRLRALRVGGSQRRRSPRHAVIRSRPRLLTLLRRAFSALRQRLRLAFVQFCRRNTPAGVCTAIERHGRLLGAGRGRGETYCAYLRRIARLTCVQDPGLPAELERLAELLERGFYGGEPMPALSGKTARGLRRRTFLALQRRLLPDAHTLSRIKQRLPAGWSCR